MQSSDSTFDWNAPVTDAEPLGDSPTGMAGEEVFVGTKILPEGGTLRIEVSMPSSMMSETSAAVFGIRPDGTLARIVVPLSRKDG